MSSRLNVKAGYGSSLLAVLLCTIALSGCALSPEKKAAVSNFGSASSTLGTLVTKEVVAMRDDVIKMNSQRILLEGEVKDVPGLNKLDENFEREKVGIITKASDTLAAYGAALSALVDDTETAELAKASTAFVASLAGIPGVSASLSSDQQSAIGTIIKQVGGFFVEYKRRKAVEKIVAESQAAIDGLCNLLERDFAAGALFSLSLQKPTDLLFGAASISTAQAKNYDARVPGVNAYILAEANRYRHRQVLKKVAESAAKLKAANAELVKAVREQTWSFEQLQDFVTSVTELRAAIKLIHSN